MKFFKIKIPKSILYLLGLAILLNLLRILIFKNKTFVYMFWNIFLAFIPFFISSILILNTNKNNIIKPFFILGFILWLLFLPNAPYVLTDFIHLGRIYGIPVMFDIFVLFSTAYVSLLMGLYSLRDMEKMILLKFSKMATNIIIGIVILFASFGMYLGRFLRFNSWDLFVSRSSLFSNIWRILTQTNSYLNVYFYTLLFFVFIYVSFIAFKSANTQ